jgi:hypothetical protein
MAISEVAIHASIRIFMITGFAVRKHNQMKNFGENVTAGLNVKHQRYWRIVNVGIGDF